MSSRYDFLDEDRQEAIDRLTGIHSSRKTYYPALREKVRQLEESNELLRHAREEAEALSAELERAVARTSSILAATRHISRHLKLRELVRETLDLLTVSMGYPFAAIHVFREGAGQQDLLVKSGAASRTVRSGVVLPATLAADPGFTEARDSGEPVVQESSPAFGNRPLMFLPITAGRKTNGMLVVGLERFGAEDLDLCRGVAQSLALAVENAILYRRVSSQARRLDSTLVTIDSLSRALTRTTQGVDAFLEELVGMVANITVSQHVAVLGWGKTAAPDPAEQTPLVPLWWTGRAGRTSAEGESLPGLTETVLGRQDPFWLPDKLVEAFGDLRHPAFAARRFARVLCIPMRRGSALEAALLAFFVVSRELAPREVEMLTILGNQAAVSFENARLYEEGERLRTQRIVQEERTRIAQELHDTVAQVLYSLGLNLDWCQSQAVPDSPLRERLGVLRELAAGCVNEMRQSIFELSPAISEYGLLEALGKLARDYPRLTGLPLDLELPPELPELTAGEQNEVYRIVQEALFNSYKHAHATRVALWLERGPLGLRVVIQDDGVGMLTTEGGRAAASLESTFGLPGMRRRAETLGGHLEVESTPGSGTRVLLELPLAARGAAQ